VKLAIHHRFPGIELVSPAYTSNTTCFLSPNQRVVAGSTTQVSFNIDPNQDESIGLVYKLQKGNTNHQPNDNIIPSEDEASYTQLFIIWKINNSKEFCVF
jgi:hypothetical protein